MTFLGAMVNNGPIPTLEAMIRFTSARHKLIVNNIANHDTPHFRAKDLDAAAFGKSLAREVESRAMRGPLQIEESAGVRRVGGRFEFLSIERPGGMPLRHDGNNVSLESENVLLAKNAMTARTMMRLLARKYRMLKSAVSGRVR